MDDSPDSPDPLAEARKEFVAFYFTATAADAALLDELISTFTVLVVAIRQPRDANDPRHAELERLTDKAELAFIAARDAVRACPTFHKLCESDRRRSENNWISVSWGNRGQTSTVEGSDRASICELVHDQFKR